MVFTLTKVGIYIQDTFRMMFAVGMADTSSRMAMSMKDTGRTISSMDLLRSKREITLKPESVKTTSLLKN